MRLGPPPPLVRARPALLALVAALVLGACTEALGPAVPYALTTRPALPFPTDALLQPDASTPTGLRMLLGARGTNLGDLDEALFLFGDVMAHGLDPLDGWSALGSAFVELPATTDLTTVVGHLLVVDLEAGAIVPTRTSTLAGTTDYHRPVTWAEAQPTRALRSGKRHAVVLTRGVRAVDGLELAPSPVFRAVLEGASEVAGDPTRVAAARVRLAGLSAALVAAGIDPADVLVAETFTTQAIVEHHQALVDAYRAQDVRPIDVDPDGDGLPNVYDAPDADPAWTGAAAGPYPHVAHTLRFVVEVPSFRATPDGPFVGEDGATTPQRWARVVGLLVVPKGAGPFPVVRFQHGLGDVKESLSRYAEGLAEAGVASVAFDAPLHGERTDRPDLADGRFIDYGDSRLVATNLREAEAESAYLVRVVDELAALDLGLEGALDPSRQLWIGNSLGAILGPGAIALEPRYEGAVLIVGGGTLSTLFDWMFGQLADFDFPFRPFLAALQAAFDRGDPSSFAASVADRQLLLLQAMDDDTIPAAATEALGRALQLPLVEPVAHAPAGIAVERGPVQRRGWLQFAGGTHSLTHHPGPVPEVYTRARASLFRFVRTWAETGVGEIE